MPHHRQPRSRVDHRLTVVERHHVRRASRRSRASACAAGWGTCRRRHRPGQRRRTRPGPGRARGSGWSCEPGPPIACRPVASGDTVGHQAAQGVVQPGHREHAGDRVHHIQPGPVGRDRRRTAVNTCGSRAIPNRWSAASGGATSCTAPLSPPHFPGQELIQRQDDPGDQRGGQPGSRAYPVVAAEMRRSRTRLAGSPESGRRAGSASHRPASGGRWRRPPRSGEAGHRRRCERP